MSRKQRIKKSKPDIDVVIATGGRFDMLTKCLDALKKQDVPHNVYVIDNNTEPEERIANEELFSPSETFRAKRLTQEVGYAQANNEGARMGNAPLIMFLNDDVELQEGAIQKVVDDFKDETVGVVGIKLLFPENSTLPHKPAGTIQHVGLALNIRGDIEHPLIGWNPNNPRTQVNRDVVAVTGACLTIRRSLFNKVGGFGLEYGLGTWEDVDLCFKARHEGFRVYADVSAWGYHHTNSTAEKKRRGFPLQQNKMLFQTKWSQSGLMIWTSADFY